LRTFHHGGPSSISGNSVNGTGTGVGFRLSARSDPPGCCNTARCVRSVRWQVDSVEQSAFFRAANVTARRHDIRVQGFFRTWQSLKSESAARLQVRIVTVDHTFSHFNPQTIFLYSLPLYCPRSEPRCSYTCTLQKTYGGVQVDLHSFLNLELGGGQSASRPNCFGPREKDPRNLLNRKLGRSKRRPGCSGEGK